jgi:hypothetical protein
MANSNRVFVSPGVYTSEKDLTFVAQSVGVTTLGLVGETLKGPAFEPILLSNFDEFKNYFGPTSPEKYSDGNPKYELGYVAKSYLQESNQLFVTRVLGLTGYKPFNSFAIKSIGGVIMTDTTVPTRDEIVTEWYGTSGFTPTVIGSNDITEIFQHLSGVTSHDGTSIIDNIVATFSGLTNTSADNGKWFAIGKLPAAGTGFTEVSGLVSTKEFVSPLTNKTNSRSNNTIEWWNTLHVEGTPGDITTVEGVYSYLFKWESTYSKFHVWRYKWDANINLDYHNAIVAVLRPRGGYDSQTLNLEVTSQSDLSLVAVDDIEINPMGEFKIMVDGLTSGSKEFTCSLDTASTKYITKVLGVDVYDKDKSDFPVYVHEVYPNTLETLYKRGYVKGLSLEVSYEVEDENYMKEWDTTVSPMVVSEVRGGEVADLFQVITISDGEAANLQVKIAIQNINLDSGEFDIAVRDFYDSDDNQVVLEKYSRCSMNPDAAGYIGKKIGTSDGEYELRSKTIMISMAENAPVDAVPAGFKGFANNENFGSSDIHGTVLYKTEYHEAGDIVSYDADGTPIIEGGDKVKKVMLGLSSQVRFDSDLLKYKGAAGTTETFGFHLSKNASTIVDVNSKAVFQCTPYDLEGNDKGKLETLPYRKFTFAVYGGHDGWDIYRQTRTNTDEYIFGKKTYISGNTDNLGVFAKDSADVANSDYYSYLQGFNTFSNPEAVDINVFATPGINFRDHSSLVNQAIDMIENERADSLYIMNSPNVTGSTAANEIVGSLDDASIDSNYSATYWPWIQVRDTDNATQLYIPPTGEVVKNIALTDNVSYPWFAVAGYSRGLVNAIKATKKLTLDERDTLYKNRINPIATFSDTGTIIWGNKTLQVRESALDRINVRRLLLRARKLISAVSVRLLFEQNDDQVRNEFLRLVNPILDSIKKERGLYDFRVSVSNDPEDIDANTLRGKIYIKPTRSLEFIDVEFIITPTGASFENI